MESLNALETNITTLLTRFAEQQERIAELEHENQRQHDEIMQSHAQLVQLRSDYNHLHTAHALLGGTLPEEQRLQARQRITNLIAQIDRALEILK